MTPSPSPDTNPRRLDLVLGAFADFAEAAPPPELVADLMLGALVDLILGALVDLDCSWRSSICAREYSRFPW